MHDLTEIAFEAVQPLIDQVNEICMDKPSRHDFGERYVIIVSEDVTHQCRENDLDRFAYWYSGVEVMVCGPDKTKCKQLCFDAFDLMIRRFNELIDRSNGPIYGLTRGEKEIGVAYQGWIPIDGYSVSRKLYIHNSIDP